MLRIFRKICHKEKISAISVIRRTFLTEEYKCTESWNATNSSPLLNKINLSDFYNQLDQSYTTKGTISAIDIDIFANAVNDSHHLEELKDLLHKLRLSAETGNTLESTSHATVRNFLQFGYIEELIEILKDPLNFGVFLDDYSANILLNELLSKHNYDLAADVASLVMLQEEFSSTITCTLCQYACYKYILGYKPPEPITPVEDKTKKVEEIKIRVKYLRNPYFDDHFDIKDRYLLCGKTLAWISNKPNDNLCNNLRLIGWLAYKKYDKLLQLCQELTKSASFKLFNEVIDIFNRDKEQSPESDVQDIIEKSISVLSVAEKISTETTLEKAISIAVENAINQSQNNDILTQKQLFQSWVETRKQKLEEQIQRLDRARRIQTIQQKQKQMQEEEQKLWFFENEDKVDLEIEEKEKLTETNTASKKTLITKTNEQYIPPEILPKRN
ncbi:hypothetical protein O3G_MSEX013011 [Manduca sexta]|uniref:28S ribosomal protein S27, mitochondrial n=1 Tax=Manduca sexta TaxID=7130 RepID=A0A921ZQ11_MANSE|nr:hypothetical protein O3G_MSEX013011 [Manduca sexta]